MTRQNAPLRIVAIGGGTGLATLLRGLKPYSLEPGTAPSSRGGGRAVEITAVVTVTDDGGSSGRLRREFDVPPPGDIRSCMVALSEDEALLSRLFQYRFRTGRGLKGHSFGNLFLTALSEVTGDFAQAVKVSSEVLAIAGDIHPSTGANVTLQARLADGTVVSGESRISRSRSPIESVFLEPRRCRPLPETCDAITRADIITFGPGSLYTSVIPNLLVEGIPEAIKRSNAIKAYIVNLMWQPGETIDYSAADHVTAIHEHARMRLIDCVLVNTRPVSPVLRRRYARERAGPVESDLVRLREMGLTIVEGDFLEESDKVRHNSEALAEAVLGLARERQWRRLAKRAATR